MRQNKRVLYLLSLLALSLPSITSALPNSDKTILISELQTGSTSLASQEFIELFNTTDQAIDVSTCRLEYFPASAANFNSPTRTIALHGILGPGQYYLVASNNYLMDQANDHYSATLAQAGGHVRLVSPNPVATSSLITYDLLGWGTAALPETSAAVAPQPGQSLERRVDDQGYLIDTDNNQSDFVISPTPTPQSDFSSSTNSTDTTTPSTTPTSQTGGSPAQSTPSGSTADPTLATLQISELLPNPAPPQTDANDEFVEIYNPNSQTVSLAGFKLQTGSTYSHSFTFKTGSLSADSYQAFYVTQTNTVLANSGGRARLINPAGEVISETAAYAAADDGVAWAVFDGNWQWTSTPTPSAANTLTVPSFPQTAAHRRVKAAKKTGRSRKKSTRKVAGASSGRSTYDAPPDTQPAAPLHPSVLVGIGALTLAYGGYEYRHDLANRLARLKRYRAARRGPGPAA